MESWKKDFISFVVVVDIDFCWWVYWVLAVFRKAGSREKQVQQFHESNRGFDTRYRDVHVAPHQLLEGIVRGVLCITLLGGSRVKDVEVHQNTIWLLFRLITDESQTFGDLTNI